MENLKTQTKQKPLKKSPLVIVETDSEELSEIIEEPPKKEIKEIKVRKEKPVKEDKRKQPRTEAQLKHFENMRKKREDNLKQKLLDKKIEASKILLENDVKPKKKAKPEESDEEEVIIIEKKKKQKPKTKRIIIEESSSDESSEEQEEKPKSKAPERKFKSQQNKKSIIKINGVNNDNDNVNSKVDYSKFFI